MFGGVGSGRIGDAWKRRHRFELDEGLVKDPVARHLTPDREALAAKTTELRLEKAGACIRTRGARASDSAVAVEERGRWLLRISRCLVLVGLMFFW